MTTIFGIPWATGAVIAFGIAVVYMFVWPRPKSDEHAHLRPVLLHLVLRWAHPLVWLILTTVCIFKSGILELNEEIIEGLAFSSLALYVLFLAAFLYDRMYLAPK